MEGAGDETAAAFLLAFQEKVSLFAFDMMLVVYFAPLKFFLSPVFDALVLFPKVFWGFD